MDHNKLTSDMIIRSLSLHYCMRELLLLEIDQGKNEGWLPVVNEH